MSGGLIKHFLAHHWKIEIKKSNGLTTKQFVVSFGRKLCDIIQVQCTEEQKNGKCEPSVQIKLGIMKLSGLILMMLLFNCEAYGVLIS